MPCQLAVDEMLTIEPLPRSSMLLRSTSRLHSIAAVTSMEMVAFQFSCSSSSTTAPRQVFVPSATGLVVANPTNCVGCRRCEAACVAFNQGKDAVAELLAFAQALETPAYRRAAEERPWLREFDKKKWADLSVIMWGTLALELAHQSDDLAALAAAVRGPVLVIVGEQDAPFLPTSHAMAGAIAGAQLVVLPEAGHSPQFESPQAWRAALTEFLAAVPVRGAAR